MDRKELLTAAEAAERLNVTKRTILRWAREGKIERITISTKVVLFTAEAIDKFLQHKTNEVESKTTEHRRAGRKTSSPKPMKKGGGKKSSGESWRSLRKEVATWQ